MEIAGHSQLRTGTSARGELFALAEPPVKLTLDTLPASVLGSLPETSATAPVAACYLHPFYLPAEQAEHHLISGKVSAS